MREGPHKTIVSTGCVIILFTPHVPETNQATYVFVYRETLMWRQQEKERAHRELAGGVVMEGSKL